MQFSSDHAPGLAHSSVETFPHLSTWSTSPAKVSPLIYVTLSVAIYFTCKFCQQYSHSLHLMIELWVQLEDLNYLYRSHHDFFLQSSKMSLIDQLILWICEEPWNSHSRSHGKFYRDLTCLVDSPLIHKYALERWESSHPSQHLWIKWDLWQTSGNLHESLPTERCDVLCRVAAFYYADWPFLFHPQ